MPNFGSDIRQSVILALQAEGADAIGIVSDALQELDRRVEVLGDQFEQKSITNLEYLATLKSLQGQIAALKGTYIEALQASDAYVAGLERAEAAEKVRIATIEALGQRARQYAQAEREVEQGLKDMAALQEHLGQMERRRHDEAAEEAHQQQLRDEIALQERLGRMEQESAQAAAQAAGVTAAARQKGIEAIVAHIDAVERQRTAEIQAIGDRARAYARAEQQQEAMDREGRQIYGDMMRERIDAIARAERQTDKWQASMKKLAPEMDAGAEASKRFGYGVLNVAHAIQDLQYGIGAILNNIPLLVQAFGGNAAWAGGIMIASVALDTLGRHIGPVAEQFLREFGIMEDLGKKFAGTIDELKANLETMEGKHFKVEVDYRALDMAYETIKEMESALAAFEAGRRDKLTEAMAREAKETTHAYGGGTEGMMEAVRKYNESKGLGFTNRALADEIAKLEKDIATTQPTSPEMMVMLQADKDRLQELKRQAQLQEREGLKREVGKFEEGDWMAIRRMQERAQGRPDLFRRVGPAGVTAAESIAALPDSPEEMLRRIDEEDELKDREEREKKRSAAWNKRKQQEKQQATRDAAEEDKAAQIAQDNADRQAKWEAKGGDAEEMAREANKAAAAQNKAAAAQNKVLTARQKQVNEQAQRFLPGYGAALERTMEGHLARRMTEQASAARLQPQLEARLQREGVAPDLQADVARAMLGKVGAKVGGRVEATGLELGVGDQQAAAVLRAQDQQQAFGRAQKERQPVQVSLLANQAMNQYGAAPDVALEFARKSVAMAQERHLTLQQTTQIVMRQMQEDQFKFLQQAGLLQMDLNLMQARQRQIGQRRRGLNEGIP